VGLWWCADAKAKHVMDKAALAIVDPRVGW
jgi:hypothetical protein